MSNIEWTDTTWNPVVGCTPVSPGCLNCYAATMARRLEAMGRPEYAPRQDVQHTGELLKASEGNGKPIWERIGDAAEGARTIRIAEVRNGRAVFTGDVRVVEDRLTDPLHWRKPRRVFVNSMSDLFHEAVPFAFIDRVFAIMALCPQHQFQVLTKRPERMAEYLGGERRAMIEHAVEPLGLAGNRGWVRRSSDYSGRWIVPTWPLPNVWLGTSVEDQARADERIPHLLRCPAAVRFLSCEPLLGPVDVFGVIRDMKARDVEPDPGGDGRYLHWIIVGGESGPNARPCDVGWIRSIVKQCEDAGVPCFVKQLGANVTTRCPDLSDGWPSHTRISLPVGDVRIVRLANRKGADIGEFPPDLLVREWPNRDGGI